MPVGASGTPASGKRPNWISAVPSLAKRWMSPLPVSATNTLPLGATVIDWGPDRTPVPYVPRSEPPRLSYSLITLPVVVTQTSSAPSIPTPTAPETPHDDSGEPVESKRATAVLLATYTTSEPSMAMPVGLVVDHDVIRPPD